MTLTFDLLTLNSCDTWRVTWPTLPPILKTLRVFGHELRVITFPIDFRWKCVRRPFCFMQIIKWKLNIRLGNRAHCIQHARIMLKSLDSHFYPKMHLTCTIFRNASRLRGSSTFSSVTWARSVWFLPAWRYASAGTICALCASVRVCVCHKSEFGETAERIELVFGMKTFSTYPTLCL